MMATECPETAAARTVSWKNAAMGSSTPMARNAIPKATAKHAMEVGSAPYLNAVTAMSIRNLHHSEHSFRNNAIH